MPAFCPMHQAVEASARAIVSMISRKAGTVVSEPPSERGTVMRNSPASRNVVTSSGGRRRSASIRSEYEATVGTRSFAASISCSVLGAEAIPYRILSLTVESIPQHAQSARMLPNSFGSKNLLLVDYLDDSSVRAIVYGTLGSLSAKG